MKKITNSAIKRFTAYLKSEEKSNATIEKYIRDVTAFARWLSGGELSKSSVLEYKEQLIKTYAPASVNSIISSLNSFFIFIGEYGLRVKKLKIQKQIFAKNEKELTKSEYERLIFAAKTSGNSRLNLIMQTICGTGIRVSELKYICVESLKSGRAEVSMKGKHRIIIIPRALCRLLKKYAAEQNISSGSIFVTKSGKPIDRSCIWKLMKSLCKRANVDKSKVFPHNLRHLFARTFYAVEKDIVRLADILGHSSVNTTRIYTMETWEICRRQVQSLGLIRC